LDLGDKHSYLCLIDQQSGEVMEEGRLRTTPEALERVMNLGENRIEMRIPRSAWFLRDLRFPHS
jgi:hypothetical protein